MTIRAFSGTTVLIQKVTSDTVIIIGQGEGTITFVQTPINITNQSRGHFIEYADGLTTNKGLVYQGTLIYNDSEEFKQVRLDAFEGTQGDYVITFGSGESYTGVFIPSGLVDTAPVDGSVVSSNVTFKSTGQVVRVGIPEPMALTTDLYGIINYENPMTQAVSIGSLSVFEVLKQYTETEHPMNQTVSIGHLTLFGSENEYTETEYPMTQAVSIGSLILENSLKQYNEEEYPMTQAVSIGSLSLIESLLLYTENELPMEQTVSIGSLTLTT